MPWLGLLAAFVWRWWWGSWIGLELEQFCAPPRIYAPVICAQPKTFRVNFFDLLSNFGLMPTKPNPIFIFDLSRASQNLQILPLYYFNLSFIVDFYVEPVRQPQYSCLRYWRFFRNPLVEAQISILDLAKCEIASPCEYIQTCEYLRN